MARFTDDHGDLERFALDRLHAADYPSCSHPYREFRCATCGPVPVAVTLEHHSGSEWGDFKGVVHGRCTGCDATRVLFGFTGSGRRLESEERPVCPCGSTAFFAGMGERYEGTDGIPGFFDEGVIVAKCAACGGNAVLAWTD